MKAIVKAIDLSNAVLKVVHAVSAKTPNPILEGIKITVKGDNMILLATDMEIAIENTIKSETFMEGEVVVLGKIFSEYVKKIGDEEDIEMSLEDDGRLKLCYGQAEGFIQTLNKEDFPIIKKDIKQNYFTINKKELKDVIGKTAFACSQDDSRPILKGCLMEASGDTLKMVALDGFRLAIAQKHITNLSTDISAIIPSRALLEISRLIENEEEDVNIIIQQNNLLINIENTVFVTRLLEGSFIDYKRIVPTEFTTTFRANKALLYSSIERASIVSRTLKNTVKFDIKENCLYVTASSEIGNVNENILINLEGKDLSILFNSKYLMDCLRVIDDEFVNFNFNSQISPCVIKPYAKEDEDYLYLILPLRSDS